MTDALICSSKGCTSPAVHQIEWNNPKIHTPDRRKVWLACDEHEPTLRSFLDARGFYKDTVPVDRNM
ncbi:acetone carboxylase [Aeromicrobium terrae]|uniref:Acetone carboxylase n=1 Tax=Aeromicrobium terrae TaxID=2498846 RepID=A0A5C8NQI3_9ACTN|nr:acetone carboxylase [Aeromicrobium terrae]TXL63135.1 acetone carboxylase [Aeromicrobium terrae]